MKPYNIQTASREGLKAGHQTRYSGRLIIGGEKQDILLLKDQVTPSRQPGRTHGSDLEATKAARPFAFNLERKEE